MTKKEQLKEDIANAIIDGRTLRLTFTLPYANYPGDICEYIHVPSAYLQKKLEYIDMAYNEDLYMDRNSDVRILEWSTI